MFGFSVFAVVSATPFVKKNAIFDEMFDEGDEDGEDEEKAPKKSNKKKGGVGFSQDAAATDGKKKSAAPGDPPRRPL